jgi:stage II sporulation protein R
MKKKSQKVISLFLLFAVGCLLLLLAQKKDSVCYQEGIAGEIIRLHVLADSDELADQMVKLKVKEAVVEALREKLSKADTIETAREIILQNLTAVEEISDEILEENGFTYTAHASLGQAVFPVKTYGDLTFPAGEYEALRIELGSGEGKNWWCVMFPTLCYVDETKQEITEENKEKFKKILTKEEYDSLTQKEGKKVFYKLKTGEYLNKVIDYFSN